MATDNTALELAIGDERDTSGDGEIGAQALESRRGGRLWSMIFN